MSPSDTFNLRPTNARQETRFLKQQLRIMRLRNEILKLEEETLLRCAVVGVLKQHVVPSVRVTSDDEIAGRQRAEQAARQASMRFTVRDVSVGGYARFICP